jgi:hypothetical protein
MGLAVLHPEKGHKDAFLLGLSTFLVLFSTAIIVENRNDNSGMVDPALEEITHASC